MERTDLLRPEDKVTITIYGPTGEKEYSTTSSGYHRLEEAIEEVLSQANLQKNPEDCVFEVTNDTKGVAHKYRINAHGNLKLIV